MILVEAVLGNAGDPEWAARLAARCRRRARARPLGGAEEPLPQEDRGRRRARGVARPRHVHARRRRAAVGREGRARRRRADQPARRDDHPSGRAGRSSRPRSRMRTCVELGHALGNQHWPALVKGNRVYVPLTVDRKVMALGHEHASLRGHPLRVRAGRRDRAVPRPARVAAALRRRRGAGAYAHARAVRRGRRRDRADLRAPAGARALASAPAPAHRRRRRTNDRRATTAPTAPDDRGAPRPHAAVRGLDVPDRRLRVLGRARIGDPEARGDRRGHAARVRAHRGRAGGARRRHRARLGASRRRGGRRRRAGADRRAGLRAQALERDADDVGAHGQEVRRDGRRGDRRAAARGRGASASRPAPRPAAIRWRWR